MATWDEPDSKGSKSEEVHANISFMATTLDGNTTETESDSEEVFIELSRDDLELCLLESLSRY